MGKIYFIRNTVDEWNTTISGYFDSLDNAIIGLQECCDWYRPKGTGKIYMIELNKTHVLPELVYEK